MCEVTCTMASLSLADDELALGVEDEHAYADSWVHCVKLLCTYWDGRNEKKEKRRITEITSNYCGA